MTRCAYPGCSRRTVQSGLCGNCRRRVQRVGYDEGRIDGRTRNLAALAEQGRHVVAQAVRPKPEVDQTAAEFATEVARAELDAGCLECGRPWRVHYRRGEYTGCAVAK